MNMEHEAMLIEGQVVSQKIREQLKLEIAEMAGKGDKLGLAVVVVGHNEASKVYLKNKQRVCDELGIYTEEHMLPANATEDEVLKTVQMLNDKPDINGILVQLPLPKQIDEKVIIEAISPRKDVDAFHPSNVGRIMVGDYHFLPCTPAGIMELLRAYNINVCGKHCVVMGRSNIVGKAIAMLLLHAHGTVTITHSRTENIKDITRQADILVVAIGKEKFVTADMVKEGAVVIDVGVNRQENGKLCGDVDFDEVRKVAGYITPVPGGVGTMTTTMLMKNTVAAAKDNNLPTIGK